VGFSTGLLIAPPELFFLFPPHQSASTGFFCVRFICNGMRPVFLEVAAIPMSRFSARQKALNAASIFRNLQTAAGALIIVLLGSTFILSGIEHNPG